MYQQYPGATSEMPEVERTPAPPSVITAIRLMYAGAVASLLYGAGFLITQSGIKTAIEKHSPHLTATQVTNQQHGLVYGGLFGAVLAAVVWVVIARACLRGRNWARITGSVLFGIFTIDVIVGLTGVAELTLLIKLLTLLAWVIGLGAVVLLWRRPSPGFFS